MSEKIKLMSHLVAGYPTDELALTAARALVSGGADMLEIQLPFSDPSADGPAIQEACTKVLSRNEILDAIWGEEHFIDENIVDVYIGYLRAKISDVTKEEYIKTVRGVGYIIEK